MAQEHPSPVSETLRTSDRTITAVSYLPLEQFLAQVVQLDSKVALHVIFGEEDLRYTYAHNHQPTMLFSDAQIVESFGDNYGRSKDPVTITPYLGWSYVDVDTGVTHFGLQTPLYSHPARQLVQRILREQGIRKDAIEIDYDSPAYRPRHRRTSEE